MKDTLNLSPDVSLDLQAITGKFGVFGVSGSGKTYTSSVLAEEIALSGAPLVIVDPLGVWYGLRVGGDGEHPLPPIYILGGEHADLPLSATSGAAIADLVVEERLSVILDLSELEHEQQARFIGEFSRRLFAANKTALHMIVDECDIAAPETPGNSEEWASRRALDAIVRRGRVKGIGITLITQRPAIVAKSLITQIGTLIVHRIAGESDRKAIDGWLKGNGTDAERKMVLGSLASLATGEAWFWSPEIGLLTKTKVRKRYTFDSSATPEVGVEIGRAVLTPLTPDALATLADRLRTEIEQAKENDPAALRAQIAALKKQLTASPTPERIEVPVEKIVERIVEVPVIAAEEVDRLGELRDSMVGTAKDLMNMAREITARLEVIRGIPIEPDTTSDGSSPEDVPMVSPVAESTPADVAPAVPATIPSLMPEEIRMLSALAEYPGNRLTISQLEILAKVSYGNASSLWGTAVANLQQLGLMKTMNGSYFVLTPQGRSTIETLLGRTITPRTVTTIWSLRLRPKAYQMFLWLLEKRPNSVTRAALARRHGLEPGKRGISEYLKELREASLILETGSSEVRIADNVP